MAPRVRYAVSDGLHIAYRSDGQGPPDLAVCEPGAASFEHLGDIPGMSAFIGRLADFARVVQFDRRGVGLSDRPSAPAAPLELRVDDLLAVLDLEGIERAAVLGIFNGAWASALFAAAHPSRVLALILHNPVACGHRRVDYPWGKTLEQQAKYEQRVRDEWGTLAYARWELARIAPSVAEDELMQEHWAAFTRRSGSPSVEIELSRLEAQMDIRSVLPSIHVPTLVTRRAGEPAEARLFAKEIPGAELVEFEGPDIAPFAGDIAALPDAIQTFLERLEEDVRTDRVLTTVLFTDIVTSTAQVHRSGTVVGASSSQSISCSSEVSSLAIGAANSIRSAMGSLQPSTARLERSAAHLRSQSKQRNSAFRSGPDCTLGNAKSTGARSSGWPFTSGHAWPPSPAPKRYWSRARSKTLWLVRESASRIAASTRSEACLTTGTCTRWAPCLSARCPSCSSSDPRGIYLAESRRDH
jgi:pimeloyl-ACP methyl ester carboxylesterase